MTFIEYDTTVKKKKKKIKDGNIVDIKGLPDRRKKTLSLKATD